MARHNVPYIPEHGPYTAVIMDEEDLGEGTVQIAPPFGRSRIETGNKDGISVEFGSITEHSTFLGYRDTGFTGEAGEFVDGVMERVNDILEHLGQSASNGARN